MMQTWQFCLLFLSLLSLAKGREISYGPKGVQRIAASLNSQPQLNGNYHEGKEITGGRVTIEDHMGPLRW